jgi:hypothetical protein
LAQETALQALHNENERLGLYKDAYGQPEQKPAAWIHIMDNTEGIKANGKGIVSITQKRKHPFGRPGVDFDKSYPVTSTPLYRHPPQRTEQEPVYHLRQYGDVTKEQLDRYIKTGDINPPAQPEPVAILNHAHGVHTFRNVNLKGLPDGEYLVYTFPPQRTEPTCPECKAEVLYECVACSSNNYPPPQRTEQEPCVHAKTPKECYRVRCQVGDKCVDDEMSFRTTPPQPEQEPVGMVKDLFTSTAWERLDLRGSTKVYLDIPPQRTEQNFCPRCGKRTPDLITIHTCTPPKENT